MNRGAADLSGDLISVIMPCYNAAAHLEAALDSVLAQTYANVEVICVDDGSTDRSAEIAAQSVARHPGKVHLLRGERSGPYPARNRALECARGAFIAFLDADDYWDPQCLTKLHHALEKSGADLAYCGWQNLGERAPGREPYIPPAYESGDVVALFLKGCPWPIHAALTRRRIIDAVGGFSERYRTSMDYDLWLRIAALTTNFVRVPEVLAYYRWHDAGQISEVKWEQVIHAWRVRREFAAGHPQRVRHIAPRELHRLIDGVLLRAAYTAYWRRDLVSAHRLFRKALLAGGWGARDLRYIVPSLLPMGLYKTVVARLGS